MTAQSQCWQRNRYTDCANDFYRAHEYNTSFVVLTFLPYHTTPLFLNLLSILPEDLTSTFKVLYPYKRSLINPPRHPILHSATTNKSFFAALNNYVLRVSKQKAHHHALLAFWAGIMTEGLAAMLDATRSGRQEVERQKHEDILLRVLPVLNDAFTLKSVTELVIGGYMVSVVLAEKAALGDKVLDGLMEAVVGSWTEETLRPGLVCLSILAQHKPDAKLPKRVFKAILRLENPVKLLSEIAVRNLASHLLLGVIAGCVNDLNKQDVARLNLLSAIFQSGLLGKPDTTKGMAIVLHAVSNAHRNGMLSLDAQTHLADLVQYFSQSESLKPSFHKTLSEESFDIATLEHNLQTALGALPEAPEPRAIRDVEMNDASNEEEDKDTFTPIFESLTKENVYDSSFLSKQSIPLFDKLAQAFALAASSQDRVESFVNLRVLGRTEWVKKPQFLSFFIRVFSGSYPVGTRVRALNIVSSILTSDFSAGLDLQALLPYILIALADASDRVRREATGLLATVGGLYSKVKDAGDNKAWAYNTLYGSDNQSSNIPWLSTRDAQKIFERALLPESEEYILDPTHIVKVLERTLRGSAASDDSSATELKKSLRLSLFTFLCSHAVLVPTFAVKFKLLKLLNNIEKAGGTTRTKELQPILATWRKFSDKEVQEICEKEHLPTSEMEQQAVTIVTPKEKDAVSILLSSISPGSESLRPSFIEAVFGRVKEIWNKIPEDRQQVASERLLDISLGLSAGDLPLADGCKEVLRDVELSGSILLRFLQKIPASLTDMEGQGPAPKRRRTSQNNMVAMTVRDDADLGRLMEKTTFILELVDNSAPEAHPELADGLFQTLAALHHFKSQIHSGMSYLLSLALGSLLAIVNRSKVGCPLLTSSDKVNDR